MSTPSIKTTVRQLGELQVRLLEAGRQGTPEVLLIHGGLGDAHLHWSKALAALGKSFHAYAPDLPGFHDGSDTLQNPSTPHLMQWINDLLRDLNVEKVFLIGTSIGALLARFYAAHYPDTVERLILVERFFQTLRRASIGFMSVFRTMLAEPWPAQQTPLCPTLIIWGQEDHLASPDEGRRLLREIPRAELVLVEKSGHMPMLEQPSVFNAAVAAFFKKERLEGKVAL